MLAPKFKILFQEDPHSYIDPMTGRVIDSVTQIIARHGYGYEGPPGYERRGGYIHEVNAVLSEGDDVDDSSVPPDWLGYVDALREFYRKEKPRVLACEVPLFDPIWDFATTPDLLYETKERDGTFVNAELKTGDSRGCDLQLGLQARAIRVNFQPVPLNAARRLQVNGDGSYRLVPYDLALCEQDAAALMRLEMRRRRGDDK